MIANTINMTTALIIIPTHIATVIPEPNKVAIGLAIKNNEMMVARKQTIAKINRNTQ